MWLEPIEAKSQGPNDLSLKIGLFQRDEAKKIAVRHISKLEKKSKEFSKSMAKEKCSSLITYTEFYSLYEYRIVQKMMLPPNQVSISLSGSQPLMKQGWNQTLVGPALGKVKDLKQYIHEIRSKLRVYSLNWIFVVPFLILGRPPEIYPICLMDQTTLKDLNISSEPIKNYNLYFFKPWLFHLT